MDDRELTALLQDLESDRVERKASASDKNRICEAICAFANDLPGHQRPGAILIGVDDDGCCTNLPITDELLVELADLRSNGNIHPFPTMTVQKRRLDGCDLVVIAVEPSLAPPVRFRGRTWVRVGPRRAIATVEEERRLAEKRRARDLPFDLWPVEQAGLEELDLELFRRTYLPSSLPSDLLEQNRRSEEHQLASLRLITGEAPPRPTTLGMLVLGKDPRRFFPGAYVQFLRIEGVKLTDPIKARAEIDGPLIDLLRILDETLEAHLSVAVQVEGERTEVEHPDYPIEALRQLSRNAILHRTYQGTHSPVRITWFSDRIEIQNPGGPYGQVTRANFGAPGVTDYRNPHLAEAMKNLGYVQRFGLGIPLAQEALAENDNPPVEFQVEDTHLLALIRRRS